MDTFYVTIRMLLHLLESVEIRGAMKVKRLERRKGGVVVAMVEVEVVMVVVVMVVVVVVVVMMVVVVVMIMVLVVAAVVLMVVVVLVRLVKVYAFVFSLVTGFHAEAGFSAVDNEWSFRLTIVLFLQQSRTELMRSSLDHGWNYQVGQPTREKATSRSRPDQRFLPKPGVSRRRWNTPQFT